MKDGVRHAMKKGNAKKEKIEHICANCEHSSAIGNTDACMCDKRGLVKARGCCGSYKTDLLKVVPAPPISYDSVTFDDI